MIAAQERVEHSFASLARKALAASEGDVDKAKVYLDRQLRRDVALRQTVIAEIMAYAIKNRVQHSMRSDRAALVRAVTVLPDFRAQRERYLTLEKPIRESLLDFTLRGGLKLRNATRATIIEQIELYEKPAADMSHKARWLRFVLQGLPDNMAVETVYTEARLLELWNESDA